MAEAEGKGRAAGAVKDSRRLAKPESGGHATGNRREKRARRGTNSAASANAQKCEPGGWGGGWFPAVKEAGVVFASVCNRDALLMFFPPDRTRPAAVDPFHSLILCYTESNGTAVQGTRRKGALMRLEASIALDALSIVYMLILIASLKQTQKRDHLNHLYFQIMLAIALFLSLDIVYLLLYGSVGPLSHALLKIAKSAYFIVNSIIVWLWAAYLDCILFGVGYRRLRHRLIYHAVLGVNMAIVAVNALTGVMFDISPGGLFVVGPAAMWTFTLLNYFTLLTATAVLVKNRNRVRRSQLVPLLVFPLPPLLAEILQIFYREYSLLCTYAVSALIVYQVSQRHAIYTDELTGLSNRRMLNERLEAWLAAAKGMTVCGLMIDLDNLKIINDAYGHASGDNALQALSGMLREITRRNLVAARYGGDEFILAWLSADGRDLPEAERELAAAQERVNRAKPPNERIGFSTGRFRCRDDEGLTAEGFIRELDRRMYRCKKGKKQRDGALERGGETRERPLAQPDRLHKQP